MKIFDVIICGGGPAGSTCALALAQSGLNVAVIEKESFPRQKICGDAIAAYVPKVLNTIHPKYKEALNSFAEKMTVSTCKVVGPNGKHIDIHSKENGFIATRWEWDNFLYTLASSEKNITYFLNHEITDVIINEKQGEVLVTTPNTLFKCKLIIGCDGAHSIVNKKIVGTKPDLEHYSGAVRGYYKNVTGIPAKTYELHFIKGILPGYFWIFPLKDNQANVGLGLLSSAISKRKINLRETMEDIIKNNSTIKDRFSNAELIGKVEGFGLPLGSRKVPISGNHFMLCGDAASLIDPATGEGIGQAMISGRYAGWQAIKCFEKQNFSDSFMKLYDKQLYDKLSGSFRKSYFIQRRILRNEWLFSKLFYLLSKSKFLQKIMLKYIS